MAAIIIVLILVFVVGIAGVIYMIHEGKLNNRYSEKYLRVEEKILGKFSSLSLGNSQANTTTASVSDAPARPGEQMFFLEKID